MNLQDISRDENRRALLRLQSRARGPRHRDSVPRTKAASAADSERSPPWPSLTGRFSRQRSAHTATHATSGLGGTARSRGLRPLRSRHRTWPQPAATPLLRWLVAGQKRGIVFLSPFSREGRAVRPLQPRGLPGLSPTFVKNRGQAGLTPVLTPVLPRFLMAGYQSSLAASWMLRVPLPPLITPTLPLAMLVSGLPRLKWLNALNASARSWKLKR